MSFAAATIASIGSVPRFVVDASIAVKWYLRDESDVETADWVQDDFRDGRVALIAPGQIRYEVPSAIRNAVRAGRKTSFGGRRAIVDFLALSIPTVDDTTLIEAGYDQASRFHGSLYDGLYVALADLLDCPLIHADRRLRNALGTGFPSTLWLTDYVPFG